MCSPYLYIFHVLIATQNCNLLALVGPLPHSNNERGHDWIRVTRRTKVIFLFTICVFDVNIILHTLLLCNCTPETRKMVATGNSLQRKRVRERKDNEGIVLDIIIFIHNYTIPFHRSICEVQATQGGEET